MKEIEFHHEKKTLSFGDYAWVLEVNGGLITI